MDHRCRQIQLDETERMELVRIRDNSAKAYMRERAAAILKIADGTCAANVAANGLLRVRQQETVRDWLTRYQHQGIQGLVIKPGRGRKPAFFPSILR